MSDSQSAPPAGASAQAALPTRDVRARLLKHRSRCSQCGWTVSIREACESADCEKCPGKGTVRRSRESIPPYPNTPTDLTLFGKPVNRLPYKWIFQISGANLYRFAARRSIDTFSLALALVTLFIPGQFDLWDKVKKLDQVWAGLFVGGSILGIGCVFGLLFASTSRGRWREAFDGLPRESDATAQTAPADDPLPWPRRWADAIGRRTRSIRRSPAFWIVLYAIGLPAVAVGLGVLRPWSDTFWRVGSLAVDVYLVVFLVFVWLCQMAFNRVPPDEYANLVLGGRGASDIFRWIAWEMHALCARFLRSYSAELRKGQEKLSEAVSTVYGELKDDDTPLLTNQDILDRLRSSLEKGQLTRLTKHIDRMERKLLEQRMGIRRCAAMKTLAATEFGIHHRRLCDHVFRFSPTIYERRSRKYIANWRAIVRSLDAGRSHVAGWRVIDLIQENERIVRRIRRRSNYLRLMAGASGVFEEVRVFASTTSLRDSLTAYASALTRIAERLARGEQVLLHQARLASLYEMQEAHPGIDLHRALTQLCHGGAPWCRIRKKEIQKRIDHLKSHTPKEWEKRVRLAEEKLVELEKHAVLWEECTSALETIHSNAGHRSTPAGKLKFLRELATLVGAATHNTQWEINRRMEAKLLEWMKDRPNVLIMTYGNSRVVRDVLKCVAMPLMAKQENATKHHDSIFVARAETDEFEARMMAFALREDNRWYRPTMTAELGYGDDELLVSMLQDRDQSVMILLGAETFDPECRIVQVASAYPRISRLKKKLAKFTREDRERVLFVAVAESYKKSDDLTRDTGFYRDHLDQVALYPKGIIDLIISNDKTYPEQDPPPPPRVFIGPVGVASSETPLE